jgi:hypothetical protein
MNEAADPLAASAHPSPETDSEAAAPVAGVHPEAEQSPPRSLDPRIQTVWILSGLIQALVLTAGACAAEAFYFRRKEWWFLPPTVLTAAVAAVSLFFALVFPRLEFRAWRYLVRNHDVLLKFGVIWRVERSVPRVRIQHADVRSGPIDRLFGLVSLTLYTAGGGEADARIPGLRPEEAEAMRDLLLRPEASYV